MADQIKGEVLIAACRFLPKCAHRVAHVEINGIKSFGESEIVSLNVYCRVCNNVYEQELPMGVDGIPHGQVTDAQIMNLPVELVPAPGEGKAIQLEEDGTTKIVDAGIPHGKP